MTKRTTVALLMACACANAGAQEVAPTWYAGLQASHVQPDGDRNTRNAAGANLFWGKPLGGGFNAEANAFGHVFHARGDERSVPAYGAGVDLNFTPRWTGGRVFALVGGGAVYERLNGPQQFDEFGEPLARERDPAVSGFARAGFGVYIPGFHKSFNAVPAYYRNRWLLRADVTYNAVFNDQGDPADSQSFSGDIRLNVGVVFARTPPRQASAPPPALPRPEVIVPADGQ